MVVLPAPAEPGGCRGNDPNTTFAGDVSACPRRSGMRRRRGGVRAEVFHRRGVDDRVLVAEPRWPKPSSTTFQWFWSCASEGVGDDPARCSPRSYGGRSSSLADDWRVCPPANTSEAANRVPVGLIPQSAGACTADPQLRLPKFMRHRAWGEGKPQRIDWVDGFEVVVVGPVVP